jgi:Rab3 GTPase-activating protein catalytic subunit
MLLVKSDEPVYIPVTQEPVPKTEDELEDDAEVMLKLGASSELRQQMMSASLLSDMESFKAANPSALFEDFIRWYSPRDWIEENPEGKASRFDFDGVNSVRNVSFPGRKRSLRPQRTSKRTDAHRRQHLAECLENGSSGASPSAEAFVRRHKRG